MPQIRAIHRKCNWGISGQLQNGKVYHRSTVYS